MAVIFTDDFESYTVGEDSGDAGPFAAVWVGNPAPSQIIISSAQAHSGSQSVFNTTGDDQIARVSNPSGTPGYGSFSFWARGAPGERGASGQIYHSGGGGSFGFAEDVSNDGTLSLFVQSPIFESITPGVVYLRDTWQHFKLVWRMSTVLPDGSAVAADGCMRVYVDDVVVATASNLQLTCFNTGWVDENSANEWNGTYIALPPGYVDDVEVTNDIWICPSGPAPPITPPTNESTPCCGDPPPGPLGPNGPNPGPTLLPPNVPLQPWNRECAGGGLVPQAADLMDVESWVL